MSFDLSADSTALSQAYQQMGEDIDSFLANIRADIPPIIETTKVEIMELKRDSERYVEKADTTNV